MPDDTQGIDPYETVLNDLYAQRDRILQAIAAIESVRGGRAAGAAPGSSMSRQDGPDGGIDGPGALLGMSIADAAKKVLLARRQPLRNPEIAAFFKAGGLILNSREPANTIGSVLTRRFTEIGDVVRVGRGTWGLKE